MCSHGSVRGDAHVYVDTQEHANQLLQQQIIINNRRVNITQRYTSRHVMSRHVTESYFSYTYHMT